MSENVAKLRIDSHEYDAQLKKATKALTDYFDKVKQGGGTLQYLDDDVEKAINSIGQMATTSTTARGKVNELSSAFVELHTRLQQLSDEEKSSAGMTALSRQLDQLKARTDQAKASLADAKNALGDTTQAAPSGGSLFGGKLDGMLAVLGGNLLTKGAMAMGSFASEMADCVKQGIELARQGEGVRLAFERLGRPDILDGLREATHGTVTDLELMKAAVKFSDFNLPIEELGTMLAFAQQKAKDTGQSVDYMVDSIVTGLGRKSVMILDNLGLSAATIKERMAETGDMTKAVGQIIREQMAQAGDYVETAADRATQSQVELTNAMERLGQTMQPLADIGTSVFTTLKVKALDLLNGALEPLIQTLTEAGRVQKLYKDQGGDEKVGRMLGRLGSIGSEKNRNSFYARQLANFDKKIAEYQQRIDDLEKFQNDNTEVDAFDRWMSFSKKTQITTANGAKEKMMSYQKMRNEYVQGAKSIMNPVAKTTDTDTPVVTRKPVATRTITPTKTVKEEEVVAPDGSIAALSKQMQQLRKEQEMVTSPQEWQRLQGEIDGVTDRMNILKGKLPKDMQAEFSINMADADTLAKLRDIEGVTISDKSLAVDVADTDALAKLRDIEGVTISDKSLAVGVADADALARLRDIEGVTISDKSLTVDVADADTLAKLRDIEGVTISDKSLAVDVADADALAKLHDIEGVTIDGKSVTVDVQNEEALAKLRSIEGVSISDKSLAVEVANADALAKLQGVEGVSISNKHLTVDVANADALAKLRGVEGVTISDKSLAVDVADADALAKLQGIADMTIGQKAVTVTATTEEAMQKVQELVASIEGTTAQLKVKPVQMKMERGLSGATEETFSAMKQMQQAKLATQEIGSEDYTTTYANLIDITAMNNLLNEAFKKGISIDPSVTESLMDQLLSGVDISDDTWSGVLEQINKKIGEGVQPIKIDFNTGSIVDAGKQTADSWKTAMSAVQSVGSALQSIEDPSAKVAGIVAQAVANIALGFSIATSTAATAGPVAWIAAIAGGLATMTSTIAAIRSATAGSYAEGGIVPGNNHSDGLIANVSSGELILNRAQQSNIAAQLSSSNQQADVAQPYVSGELIFLAVNNYMRRAGYGEIVGSRR